MIFAFVVPPSGKNVKKPRPSFVSDNRLASNSSNNDVTAGSENDEDADYNELHDIHSELDGLRSDGFTNRKRKGMQKCCRNLQGVQ